MYMEDHVKKKQGEFIYWKPKKEVPEENNPD